MADKLNFEDFEKDLNDLDLVSIENDLNSLKTVERASLSDAKEVVCRIYSKIRPILKGITKIPFIPKKIKDAIEMLCNALDLLCALG